MPLSTNRLMLRGRRAARPSTEQGCRILHLHIVWPRTLQVSIINLRRDYRVHLSLLCPACHSREHRHRHYLNGFGIVRHADGAMPMQSPYLHHPSSSVEAPSASFCLPLRLLPPPYGCFVLDRRSMA